MMGVGLAFDKAGEPWLAYTGGPSAQFRCGASDMLLASVSGGVLGTPSDIAAGSQSSDMPADQAANCVQNVCNLGDATGYWPAAALDPSSGHLAVVFRDLHFGFADTDFNSSDVEFAIGDQYSIYTVDVARGGGTYLRPRLSPTGKGRCRPLQHGQAGYLAGPPDRPGMGVAAAFVGSIHEQIGFAVSSRVCMAAAYCDDTRQVLTYKRIQRRQHLDSTG